jgi:hypothetical protein
MTTRVIRRQKRPPLSSVQQRIDDTLAGLQERREALTETYQEIGLSTRPWFSVTVSGLRHFVFPRLPADLSIQAQGAICERWAKAELVNRGIVVIFHLLRGGPIFSCSIRTANRQGRGFGKLVKEWGSDAFFDDLRATFTAAVNGHLQSLGLPETYR